MSDRDRLCGLGEEVGDSNSSDSLEPGGRSGFPGAPEAGAAQVNPQNKGGLGTFAIPEECRLGAHQLDVDCFQF